MYKWDWYQTTVHKPIDVVIKAFKNTPLNDLTDFTPCTPRNGYSHAAAFKSGDRDILRIMWGGNSGVNLLASSSDAPLLADVLASAPFEHRPTRVDACVDLASQGLYDSLSRKMLDFAKAKGLKINQQGDWERGRARTLYIGAPSSPVRLRMYEKGCQMLDQFGDTSADPNWVRVEVEVRPKSHARGNVASWTPEEAFTRACAWLSELWQVIEWGTFTPHSIGTVRKDSDTLQQRRALVRQYGRILEQWLDETSSADEFVDQFKVFRKQLLML